MVTTIVNIKVKKDSVDKFIEATIKNHTQSIKEKGNLRFDFLQDLNDPSIFVLYEAYETEEQAKAHKNTAHYMKWRDAVESFMEQKRVGIAYKVIKP